ncbi:MAG: alpha/beta fold hydrolase [Deltaproteobacteria bacterium]|nr:alpha/beta fold hydrolase [Nannocystaceae bacterium]
MTELLPCVEVEPREPARASVIFLHGLGADGHDFEPVVPILQTTGVRFVFPHAPALPVMINNGYSMPAWYDVRSLDFDAVDRENPQQVAASTARVEALIARERARGIPSERIVLGGFSQGAAMAIHAGVRHGEALAGLLVLSGYLVCASVFERERSPANLATPVLQCHGRHDSVVPFKAGRDAHALLQRTAAPGTALQWQEYPIAHEVSPEELALVGGWLRARFD